MPSSPDVPLPLPGHRRGKVRDIYDLPPDGDVPRLLIVASDRLSAFDVVLPTRVPGKGVLLTRIALRWFRWIEERALAGHHVLGSDVHAIPELDAATRVTLAGRATIARRCEVVPVECVVRGYLDGSGWRAYERDGAICGVELPAGLRRGDRLPEPIFTPATKAEAGAHDENIDFDRACVIAGAETMERLRATTLRIYEAAHAHAEQRGLLLADTKFEFGHPVDLDGAPVAGAGPILVDEVLTPDSSRYWPADGWRPGGPQHAFDKQYVREHLQTLVDAGRWDKTDPGPELPAGVVEQTMERYRAAERMLFGAEG